MTDKHPALVQHNPWRPLRAYTDARIGLGRAGTSLPTHELLAFQLAHAQARDAVHLPLDQDALAQGLAPLPDLLPNIPPLRLHSQASDRLTYLQRPDLGRRLDDASRESLQAHGSQASDLALVVVDGLSSIGVQNNTAGLLRALVSELERDDQCWRLAPLALVSQGRVAIGDDIGQLLNASAVLVLIGERPGLSSPDSLGAYLTWAPRPGRRDAERNCVSNIRAGGLCPEEAARRLGYLLREARRRRLSGVELKDRSEDPVIAPGVGNFLLD